MNKREFSKLLNKITTKKRLDLNKIVLLTNSERSDMVYFIVRNRCAVIKDLIPEGFDYSWLHCMGYMQESIGKQSRFTFIHNSEQRIV